MTLEQAYSNVQNRMVPQKQGTCGLYSFWYATLLLEDITKKPSFVYPRRGQRPQGSTAETLRHWIKHTYLQGQGLNSQGEILTVGEMTAMIQAFGYRCDPHQASQGRDTFITSNLARDRPVAVAYLHSLQTNGPVSTAHGNGMCGGHWVLVYKETSTAYTYLNPHNPTTPVTIAKNLLLDSNAAVDSAPLAQFWEKGARSSINPVATPAAPPVKTYNIGTNRQNLNNALVSIFT